MYNVLTESQSQFNDASLNMIMNLIHFIVFMVWWIRISPG